MSLCFWKSCLLPLLVAAFSSVEGLSYSISSAKCQGGFELRNPELYCPDGDCGRGSQINLKGSIFAADGIATSYTMTAKAYIRSLVSTTISSDTVIYPCSYLTPGNSKYYTCPASGLYTFDLSYTLPDSNLWSSTGETIQVSVKLKSQDQGVSNTKCIMYLKPQGASSYGMYTSTAGASVLVLGAAAVYFGKARKCLSIDQEEEEEEAVEPQAINFEMMGGPSTHVRFEEKV